MAPTNVDLVEMAHSAVAGGNSNVFELNVHIVFGYIVEKKNQYRFQRPGDFMGKAMVAFSQVLELKGISELDTFN